LLEIADKVTIREIIEIYIANGYFTCNV